MTFAADQEVLSAHKKRNPGSEAGFPQEKFRREALISTGYVKSLPQLIQWK